MMLRRSALYSTSIATISMAACLALCSCSATQKAFDASDYLATYVKTGSDISVTTSSTTGARAFSVSIDGNAEIEAMSNCILIDNSVIFVDKSKPAEFRIIVEVGYLYDIEASAPIHSSGQIVSLDATSNYGDISIIAYEATTGRMQFTDVEHNTISAGTSEEIAEEGSASSDSSEAANATSDVCYSENVKASAVSEPNYETPAESAPPYEPETNNEVVASQQAPIAATTPAQITDAQNTQAALAPQPTTQTSAPAASSTSSLSAQKVLTEEERLAREIFNEYNNFRASRGLCKVTWSDYCASMATGSASGCASKGMLVHRLGIPASQQGSYSDILQYASWKLSATEALNSWINSTGHRRQMQCVTATEAGVGVVKDGSGRWYVAVVYNFNGTNVGGN